MGSGCLSMSKILPSIPLYNRCSILSNSAEPSVTGKNSSMREIPVSPMFWVISTALVLHGVIISLRGPINQPFNVEAGRSSALSKSHDNFLVSSAEKLWSAWTAIMFWTEVLKKMTIVSCFLVACLFFFFPTEKSRQRKRIYFRCKIKEKPSSTQKK